MKIAPFVLFLSLAAFLTAPTKADLIVDVDFGGGEVTASGTITASTAGVTGLSGDVTFDLSLTANNFWGGSGIGVQNLGIGVQGGQAGAGIDNNFNGSGGTSTTVTESMDVAVSNLSGTGVLSIEIVDFGLLFGVDAGANTEYYSIDGGAATSLTSTPETIALAGGTTAFNIGSLDLDGTGSDSRYALDRITVLIVTVPEPGASLVLVGTFGFFLSRRRR